MKIAFLICSVLLVAGCAQSYESSMRKQTSYPCDDLARTQKRYARMKKSRESEADLRALRQQIGALQVRCTDFRKAVDRYVDVFGYTREDAERKAAEVTRSVPLSYSQQTDAGSVVGYSLLVIAGVILGAIAVIWATYPY